MPLYEYECGACGRRFELIRRFSDPAVDVCTLCGKGPVNRLVSSPAIQFKGSGWYITDYAQKKKSEDTPKEKTETAAKESPSGAASSGESKSDTGTKSESTSAPASAPAKIGSSAKD
jgi:putative FmdB family regulatory protein